eukprot:5577243-Prymnesium_polylepis.1
MRGGCPSKEGATPTTAPTTPKEEGSSPHDAGCARFEPRLSQPSVRAPPIPADLDVLGRRLQAVDGVLEVGLRGRDQPQHVQVERNLR